MGRLARVVVLIAVVIVSFAAGRLLTPDPPAAPAAAAHPERSAPPAPAAAARGLTAEEVRAAVRAELDRERPATVAAADPADEPEPADRRERRSAAFEEAQVLVSDAVDLGRWTPQNARALRRISEDLGPEDMDVIMASLIAPANEGRLRVETAGSLLNPNPSPETHR